MGSGAGSARCVRVDPDRVDEALLREAADLLRGGGLVAFPTETVYGLGANALDRAAVARIFAAKGRPSDNPIIVHAPDAATAWLVTSGPTPLAARLAAAFWPGPLTLVLGAAEELPRTVTAGLDSVAVRVPDHPVALALLRLAGVPVAAPSANRSGRPSPTSAAHVLHDLGDRVDLVVDGGTCRLGLESTVVDVRGERPMVLREGAITRERIAAQMGPAPAGTSGTSGTSAPARTAGAGPGMGIDRGALPDLAASPGTRHRHYAPACRVVIADAGSAALTAARLAADPTLRVGFVARADAPAGVTQIARFTDSAELATCLYQALRDAESAGLTDLVVEAVPETGIGRAVMDRLRRAAGQSA